MEGRLSVPCTFPCSGGKSIAINILRCCRYDVSKSLGRLKAGGETFLQRSASGTTPVGFENVTWV